MLVKLSSDFYRNLCILHFNFFWVKTLQNLFQKFFDFKQMDTNNDFRFF